MPVHAVFGNANRYAIVFGTTFNRKTGDGGNNLSFGIGVRAFAVSVTQATVSNAKAGTHATETDATIGAAERSGLAQQVSVGVFIARGIVANPRLTALQTSDAYDHVTMVTMAFIGTRLLVSVTTCREDNG